MRLLSLRNLFLVSILVCGYFLFFVLVFCVSKQWTYEYINQGNWTVIDHPKNINFQRTLSPLTLCGDPRPFLVIYVHSAPSHLQQRTLIRKTYAHPYNVPGIVVRTLFVIGASPAHQVALAQESAMYGDILQEDYVDSYRNLSLKALSALRFIDNHCRSARFILKADDDIFVNIFALVRHLQATLDFNDLPPRSVLCFLWPYMPVIRDPKSKWYVSPEEWPQEAYTDYCSGSAFILTVPAITAIVNAVPLAPFHWVDDFYVTGLLADKAQVHKTSIRSLYRLNFKQYIDEFHKNFGYGMTLLFSHTKHASNFRALWNRLARPLHGVTVSQILNPVLQKKQ